MKRTAPLAQILTVASVLGLVLAASACASYSMGSQEEESLTVQVHVSGFPGVRGPAGGITLDTLSFEVLINGVQVLDTTFVPMINMTGHVHSQSIRVAPGSHRFRVIDRRTSTIHDGRLRTREGPMWVHIRFSNEGAAMSTGYGILGFL